MPNGINHDAQSLGSFRVTDGRPAWQTLVGFNIILNRELKQSLKFRGPN